MGRIGTPLFIALLALTTMPRGASAGGVEFPADGSIGLGRGGTGFLRADDPTVMIRNPALLADLWDDQITLGAHFLIPDACFRATGAYGWGVVGDDVTNVDEEVGPVYLQAKPGSTDADGNPVEGYFGEPYPTVCYSGPMPFLPTLALSHKLADNLGIGLGFFTPDVLSLSQFGNPDGTVDTPQGKRPSPTRYTRGHLNVSYATLMGSVGYRPADWIRIGVGFQWSLVAFESRTFTVPSAGRTPRTDIRADLFGRDLFVPGFVTSVHIVPHDNLDVAIGFKWQDNIDTKAKLDLHAGTFGASTPYDIIEPGGMARTIGTTIPENTNNQPGSVTTNPIWAPQLSAGIRYGHRLKPRTRDWDAAHDASNGKVEDHMATELFDVEFNVIYYMNSAYEKTVFVNDNAVVDITNIDANGNIGSFTANVGECTDRNPTTNECDGVYETELILGGKNLWSLRLGGDYNVLPGKLAIRGGVSYETDGADPAYLDIHNYYFGRIGAHGGLTWRVADHTDFTFAYAHFFLKEIKLQVNPKSALTRTLKTAEYGFEPGAGEADASGMNKNADNGFDGVAGREVPYGDAEGPHYANAGTFKYNLDVLSIAFTQHF